MTANKTSFGSRKIEGSAKCSEYGGHIPMEESVSAIEKGGIMMALRRSSRAK
jgi:hypothetical protein